MKKLLLTLVVLAWTATIGTNSFASSCRNVDFNNGNVCVNIVKVSGETFKLTTNVTQGNGTLRCGVLLPDRQNLDLNCNGGTFNVSNLDSESIKIFIKQGDQTPSDWDNKPNSDSKWLFPQWYYDFRNEEWTTSESSSSNSSSSSNYSNSNINNFSIALSNSNPTANNEVKLTLKALDSNGYTLTDYDGSNAKVTIAYRSSSSNSWTTTTSSTYFSIDDTTPNFSNGSAYTYMTFKKNYQYKITVTDNNNDAYTQKIYYVGSSSSNSYSSNSDLNNFYVTSDDSSPDTNQRVDVSVKARDYSNYTITDYDGKVRFKVEKKSGSSWVYASSSSYELSRTYYTFTSYDDGVHSFSDLVRFKNSGEYRLTIYDDTNSNIYTTKLFDVGYSSSSSSSNSDLNNFSISTSDSSPSTNEEVKLSLKARDSSNYTVTDYYGSNAKVTVAYRTSSSSSWNTTTSSTYFSIDDDTPSFSNGSAYTYITFKKNYQYRITVTDYDSDVYSQQVIYMNGSSSSSSSNSNLDNFYITTDDSSPSTNQEVKLSLKARDSSNYTITDYYGSNAKVTIAYRSSSSNSWTTTTSSSYFSIDDDTPNFSNGSAYTYITFKKNYQYKITVTDYDSDVYSQQIIYMNGSSSSSSNSDIDNFSITTDDSSPSTNQSVYLTIKARDYSNYTISNYNGENAKITVAYRSSSSDSWTTTTSSTYYSIDDSTPTFSNGSAYTYISFKKNYEYRITVTDYTSSNVYTQKTISVDGYSSSSSSTYGFTSSQLDTIRDIYNSWNSSITSLKNGSSNLRYNTTRQSMSDNLKTQMGKILNNDSSRSYDNYDQYQTAFSNRYEYTIQHK